MKKQTKLRVRVNPRSLVKAAGLVSNTVLLTANVFLIGSNISGSIRERRKQQTAENLQLTADISTALANITRIITETVEKKNA